MPARLMLTDHGREIPEMARRVVYARALLASLVLFGASAAAGQEPAAPRITASEPVAMAASRDPFNMAILSDLAPGMVIEVSVTPDEIALQRAFMMATPRTAPAAETSSDEVVATLYGGGVEISRAAVADPTTIIGEALAEGMAEGAEIIRREDRTVSLAIPTPRLVDTLEITVTATGQTATFDVADVMARYCASVRREPSCEPAPKGSGPL